MRCFCSLQPKRWAFWLPWAEWSYNNNHHTATNMTPYEVVYGLAHLEVPLHEDGTTKLEMVDRSLQERNRVLSLLNANLEAAQNRKKIQADKHRIERDFDVGDLVYL